METTTVTQEQVLAKVARDDRYAVNCLLQLYARQTADEQAAEVTVERNGVGFNGADAELLSSFARQAAERRRQRERGDIPAHWTDLSPRQMELLRKKLAKYARQLTELTNAALAARAGATAEAEGAEVRANLVSAAVQHPSLGDATDRAREFVRTFGTRADLEEFDRNNALREVVAEGEHLDELPAYEFSPLPEEAVAHLREELPAICHAVTAALPARNGFDVPPSCRLVEDGASLRFPTARELSEGGDQGARALQRSLSAARWTRPCEPDEDVFSG